MNLEHVLYEKAAGQPDRHDHGQPPGQDERAERRGDGRHRRGVRPGEDGPGLRRRDPDRRGRPKAFVAGADISELAKQGVLDGKAKSHRGQASLNAIENLGKPVIAMINGYAFGGGMEISLACHLRTMADDGEDRSARGRTRDLPGLRRYTAPSAHRRPRPGARDASSAGIRSTPSTALQYGLVNRVAPAAELRAVTEQLAKTLLKRGPLAVQIALESVLRGTEVGMEEGLRIEADLFGIISATKDMREGLTAFLEKRKPDFRGE